jgi:hypothetical protein
MDARGSIGKSSVKRPGQKFLTAIIRMGGLGGVLGILFLWTATVFPQAVPYARAFAKPAEEVEARLKDLQAYSGQKLPTVDGFVATGEKPLNQFERAFYQFSIDLLPGTGGGTIVRVTAKITAWYADKDPAKSGYQVLPSSGRLELDLLDRLEEKFGGKTASSMARALSNSTISAPKPKLDLGGVPGVQIPAAANTATTSGTTAGELGSLRSNREAEEKHMRELNAELQSLQEIKKNQVHPLNLVVVKKTGTPVLAKPAEGARVLFNAAAEDEFEFVDAEGEWIHVQISGPSRGYVRRNNIELPEFIAARLNPQGAAALVEIAAAFRIVREENSPFPGDWEPLKGKAVKLFTVQPVSQDPKETGTRAKLAFASSLFQNFATDNGASASGVEGVVVIFDSADGGIVGATLATLKQFTAGTLSLENFWKECYRDPLDAFQESRKP